MTHPSDKSYPVVSPHLQREKVHSPSYQLPSRKPLWAVTSLHVFIRVHVQRVIDLHSTPTFAPTAMKFCTKHLNIQKTVMGKLGVYKITCRCDLHLVFVV